MPKTTRPMSKSPVAAAREALRAAAESLPAYSSPRGRKDFTRHRLFAVLVPRPLHGTDLRGIAAIPADSSDLRAALGPAKVPHFSTLGYAARRLVGKGASSGSSRAPSRAPAGPA